MKVSVICPTFGRIPYLNRLLASFLSQTYDDKELVLVNDDKNIQLCCDYDNVRCINLNKKILLPQKRNVGIGSSYSDLIMQHDDDDIFLPFRLARHVKRHQDDAEMGVYYNSASYVVYGNDFGVNPCTTTACSYKRKVWYDVGGYANKKTGGEDTEFWYKLSEFTKVVEESDPNNVDYVYNYGGINYHSSFQTDANILSIAEKQLIDLGLMNKKYWIEPDFVEYEKFVKLHIRYSKGERNIKVKHVGDAKINV